MKNWKNRFVLFLGAALLLMGFNFGVRAASAQPGQTAYVSFSMSGIYGIQGSFSYSNPAIITSISSSHSFSGLMGFIDSNSCALAGASESSGSITLAISLSADAAPGDSCTVTFTYQTSDGDGQLSGTQVASGTVTVEAPPTEPTTQPTESTTKPTEPTTKPTEPTTRPTEPTEPTTRPTQPTQPTTRPTEPTTKPTEEELNTAQLEARIQEAQTLEEKAYTEESWKALETALEGAESALDSDSQSRIDGAEQSLRQAIAKLVKLDYTQLQAALEEAEAQRDSEEGQLWQKLLEAAQESEKLLESRDQEEIDAAAEALQELLEQLAREPQPTEPEQTEAPTQETTLPEVTEPPAQDGGAGAWPVFLILSLLVNAGLIGWILWSRRSKSSKEEAVFRDIELEEDEE